MKHVIAHNTSLDRVFNMDETGLSQKSRQTKVVGANIFVVKGLRNLWSRFTQCNFHFSIVACA